MTTTLSQSIQPQVHTVCPFATPRVGRGEHALLLTGRCRHAGFLLGEKDLDGFRIAAPAPSVPRPDCPPQSSNVAGIASRELNIKALEIAPGWRHENCPPGDVAVWERANDVLFSPLITQRNNLACEPEIIVSRQQAPGELLGDEGDIDNRLKTLFDALHKHSAQGARVQKRADHHPIHCLLQR
jgi:hypothetical protein